MRAHDVFYKGFREGKGIWGTWEIRKVGRGGFHIWPLGGDGDENEAEDREHERPVEISAVVRTSFRIAYLSSSSGKSEVWLDTQCHLPSWRTNRSVKRSLLVKASPFQVPFDMPVPITTAASP